MNIAQLQSLLDFIKNAEQLKDTLRTGITTGGRKESVADHTWRLALLAVVLQDQYFAHLDFKKLIKICLIHDLGEAINGDIPAPLQSTNNAKSQQEREDLKTVLAPLPAELKSDFLQLWDEYENVTSEEAKLAKALDKLETMIQHNQVKNDSNFDYAFNLTYGKKYTDYHEVTAVLRQMIDEETQAHLHQQSMSGG